MLLIFSSISLSLSQARTLRHTRLDEDLFANIRFFEADSKEEAGISDTSIEVLVTSDEVETLETLETLFDLFVSLCLFRATLVVGTSVGTSSMALP